MKSILVAQPKAAVSPPKIAAKQANFNVSFMALRSCNVVCYKTVCAKLKYITLKNEPIRRPDFLRPSILLAPCEANESLAKTFWVRTDVPFTKFHS